MSNNSLGKTHCLPLQIIACSHKLMITSVRTSTAFSTLYMNCSKVSSQNQVDHPPMDHHESLHSSRAEMGLSTGLRPVTIPDEPVVSFSKTDTWRYPALTLHRHCIGNALITPQVIV
eukprot:gb/GECG01000942.1/.p1 GENE.gb/GECG01000942.1/~~gb/GECG01000942.1/.p1  ORF type:complete len:117 (+),score=4.54 gb/GECG01000942.1/:1-351(+)